MKPDMYMSMCVLMIWSHSVSHFLQEWHDLNSCIKACRNYVIPPSSNIDSNHLLLLDSPEEWTNNLEFYWKYNLIFTLLFCNTVPNEYFFWWYGASEAFLYSRPNFIEVVSVNVFSWQRVPPRVIAFRLTFCFLSAFLCPLLPMEEFITGE